MNRKYDREIIIVSFYSHIIQNILREHEKLSTLKIMVFAFLEKKQKISSKVYTSNNKNDVMLKFISQMSGEFSNFTKDLEFLLKSIDILIKNKKIINIDGILHMNNYVYFEKDKINLLDKAIQESKYYSDEQFLKEILYYV